MIFSGLQFLAKELLARAEEELYDEDKIHQEMTEAYACLEAGSISEAEFDRREKQLMDRLETVAARRLAAAGGQAADGDDDDEDEDDDKVAGVLDVDLDGESDDDSGNEVHYGVFDDEADEVDDYDEGVRGRVEAHASRRSP